MPLDNLLKYVEAFDYCIQLIPRQLFDLFIMIFARGENEENETDFSQYVGGTLLCYGKPETSRHTVREFMYRIGTRVVYRVSYIRSKYAFGKFEFSKEEFGYLNHDYSVIKLLESKFEYNFDTKEVIDFGVPKTFKYCDHAELSPKQKENLSNLYNGIGFLAYGSGETFQNVAHKIYQRQVSDHRVYHLVSQLIDALRRIHAADAISYTISPKTLFVTGLDGKQPKYINVIVSDYSAGDFYDRSGGEIGLMPMFEGPDGFSMALKQSSPAFFSEVGLRGGYRLAQDDFIQMGYTLLDMMHPIPGNTFIVDTLFRDGRTTDALSEIFRVRRIYPLDFCRQKGRFRVRSMEVMIKTIFEAAEQCNYAIIKEVSLDFAAAYKFE